MAAPKILMVTNAELGQANVYMATTHALRQQNPSLQLHIASFPSLEKTLHAAFADMKEEAPASSGSTEPIFTFHTLPGRTMFECFEAEADPADNILTVSLEKPGFWHTPTQMRFVMQKALICWSSDEFKAIYETVRELIDELEPDLVLVDMIFSPGLTAARHLRGRTSKAYKLAVLSPNSLKDYVAHLEPGTAMFWKWPIVASGQAMPIPWTGVLLNIYLAIRLIWYMVTNPRLRAIKADMRKSLNEPSLEVVDNVSSVNNGLDGVEKVFIGGRAEVDFPQLDLVNPPKAYMDKIVACGPILRPIVPIDGELASWLRRGPVVFIALGSHCLVSEEEAVDMARSLKTLLDEAKRRGTKDGLQVLWKLQKDVARSPNLEVGPGSAVYEILGKEMEQDRVRIVKWLTSEPNSILNTGDVVCAIDHGGANSYYEALW